MTTNYISSHGMVWGEMSSTGVVTSYGHDALGSVTETYQNGTLQNTYRYKPYGGLLAKTGTAPDPSFLWNGGSGYRATNLPNSDYYVRRRHYSTVSSKWTTADPLWPRAKPYAYCYGSPAFITDPTGLSGTPPVSITAGKFSPPQPTLISVPFSAFIDSSKYGQYVDLTFQGSLSILGVNAYSGTDRPTYQNAPNRFQTLYSIMSNKVGINDILNPTNVGFTDIYTNDVIGTGKTRRFHHQGYVASEAHTNWIHPCISAIHKQMMVCAALFPSWSEICITTDIHLGFAVSGPTEITIKIMGEITEFPSFDQTIQLDGGGPFYPWWNISDSGEDFAHPFFGLTKSLKFGPNFATVENVITTPCPGAKGGWLQQWKNAR